MYTLIRKSHLRFLRFLCQVSTGKYSMDPAYWGKVSSEAKDLVRRMMEVFILHFGRIRFRLMSVNALQQIRHWTIRGLRR